MRSVIQIFFISLMITTFISCDQLSELMTKNYFSEQDDSDSISVSNTDFQDLGTEDQTRVTNKYSSMALDPAESKKLFDSLKEDEQALLSLISIMENEISKIEEEQNISQSIDVRYRYQKLNVALSKIYVYPRDNGEIEGVEKVLVGYESGLISEKFDISIIQEYIFDIESQPESDRLTELKRLFKGMYGAGIALNRAGQTIIDLDFPSSPYVTEEDAAFVLLSLIIYKIISDTASESEPPGEVAEFLATDIDNKFYRESIIYPNEMNELPYSHRYLGVYGSLIFAATNFTLPDIVLMEGGE